MAPVAVGSEALTIPAGSNTFWYVHNDSSTAVVFLHGILSNSQSCWTFAPSAAPGTAGPVYWPDLVRKDHRLGHPSIYMAGYTTFPGSGDLIIKDAAREVLDSLRIPDSQERQPLLEKPVVVFVCHSTGGIVARYMLERNQDMFKDKLLGLVLIASPSYGSLLASGLRVPLMLFRLKMGWQLRWGGENLDDLDGRFKDLLEKKRLRIHGIEAYEHYFIFRRIFRWFLPEKVVEWLPNSSRRVVDKLSAGRYFGDPKLLPKTDHFSAVKPDNENHPAHRLLVEFFTDFNRHRKEFEQRSEQIFESVDRIRKAAASLGPPRFKAERVRRRAIVRHPDAELEVSEDLVNVTSKSQSTTTLIIATDAPIEFEDLRVTATVTAGSDTFEAPLQHKHSKDGRSFLVDVSFHGILVPPGGTIHLEWSCRLPGSVAKNEDYWVYPALDLHAGGELMIEAVFSTPPEDAALCRIVDHVRNDLPLPRPSREILKSHEFTVYRSSHVESAPGNGVYVVQWRLT